MNVDQTTDWATQLNNETAVNAYLDLTNMFHWQDVLGWKFRIEDVISELRGYENLKEVKVYYGLNTRDFANSEAFHKRIRKTGAILKDKQIKYVRRTIKESMFFKKSTMNSFDQKVVDKVRMFVSELRSAGIVIEEQKCNFDVEMTMDILDDISKVSGIMLFSGDSDLEAPIERAKVEKRKVYIVGVRGMVATELRQVNNIYIDFGKFYRGKRNYAKSENPAFGGTA